MAYIVLADRKQELDRRELRGRIVIGRALDCDITVRDILLSRHHCAIEPAGEQWLIIDLGSKNGTIINGQTITRHVLREGDMVQMGRTRLSYHPGPFIPSPSPAKEPARSGRPADPHEALAGTVAGFRFVEEEAEEVDVSEFPRPRPRPPTPSAYQTENVQKLVSDISSSSWDSIIADASRKVPPQRPLPVPPRIQRKSSDIERAEQSLRVHPSDLPNDPPREKPPVRPAEPPGTRRWRRQLSRLDRRRAIYLSTIAVSLVAWILWLAFLSSQW